MKRQYAPATHNYDLQPEINNTIRLHSVINCLFKCFFFKLEQLLSPTQNKET